MAEKLNTLHALLVDLLKDTYDAEHQITKALPKMAKQATSSALRTGFEQHLMETEVHIQRLEQVFAALGESPERKACKAMQGLVAEGEEVMKEKMDPDVMDAALIAAAQKVEHYEMAAYGTMRTFAQQMGHDQVAQMLQTTLDEEGTTDKKLTMLAESAINWKAMS
jgi:ferritin-like metal-binding protein YciE